MNDTEKDISLDISFYEKCRPGLVVAMEGRREMYRVVPYTEWEEQQRELNALRQGEGRK